jgi:hypothetical protein
VTSGPVETTHRGVRWRRDPDGNISFYDTDGERWVTWASGADAPPRPPGWAPAGARPARPAFLTPWRVIPLVLVVVAVVIAVVQVLRPSGNQTAKEAAASKALLGQCLAEHGTSGGHPKYSSTAVPCNSSTAAVKVVAVIPSTPGNPLCAAGTTGVELPYPGVQYPHIMCVQPVHPSGGGG